MFMGRPGPLDAPLEGKNTPVPALGGLLGGGGLGRGDQLGGMAIDGGGKAPPAGEPENKGGTDVGELVMICAGGLAVGTGSTPDDTGGVNL